MACALPASVLLIAITASYGDNGSVWVIHPGYNQACVPGTEKDIYGNDCVHNAPTLAPPTPAPPVPLPEPINEPDSVPVPATSPAPLPSDSETGPGETLFPPVDPDSGSTQPPSCKLLIPQECVFPFEYKNLEYTTCTGVDAVNTLWCSNETTYNGHWKQCEDPCKNKWPVKAIVSSVVAGGVAVTGIGLIAAAVDHNNKHPGTPFLGGDWGKKNKSKSSIAAKVAPVATVGHPVVLCTWCPPNIGLGVMSIPVPATQRLLGAAHTPASVPVAALGPLVAFVAVVSIAAAGAIYHGINREKQAGAPDQQIEEGTGYLEVSPVE